MKQKRIPFVTPTVRNRDNDFVMVKDFDNGYKALIYNSLTYLLGKEKVNKIGLPLSMKGVASGPDIFIGYVESESSAVAYVKGRDADLLIN